ncbi:MAG: hypothetical protein ACRYGI_13610, partial [Janthinobacterium lividum]
YLPVSDALTQTEKLQQELGLPIAGNSGQFYNDSRPGIQSHTIDIEAIDQIHVMRGVTFAPDSDISSVRMRRRTCMMRLCSASRPISSCSEA